MSNIRIESELTAPQDWDEFVMDHPEGKLYHLTEWTEMIRDTFGHATRYIALRNGSGIEGVLPVTEVNSLLFGRLGVSLPFVNYGGPLFKSQQGIGDLMDHLADTREKHKLKSIELRLDKEMQTSAPCKTHKVTFFLDLPEDPEVLFKGFKAKLRSQIRRPEKDEMYAKSGGIELLDDFYDIFTVNMRDLGTPVLPRKLFHSILTKFPDHAFIVCVYSKEGEPAAASFLIKFHELMEIPWASAIRKFNRSSPNMMMYWESLKLSIRKGCRRFDFGRCSPGSGTYKFKKQWGSEEQQLFWYYVLPENETLPEISPANPKYDMMVKVWQKLPVPLANAVGPFIIKHIP